MIYCEFFDGRRWGVLRCSPDLYVLNKFSKGHTYLPIVGTTFDNLIVQVLYFT